VTASEGGVSQVFNETLLKQLPGGDTVTCRFLHRELLSYTPSFKVLFATNELPRLSSQSHGLRRREWFTRNLASRRDIAHRRTGATRYLAGVGLHGESDVTP
jgi:hypothetical protein